MMKRISLVFTVCIVILVAGCMTVGPDYVPTEPKVPEQFSSDLSGGLTVEPLDKATLSQWWATLNDPELTDLIDRAIAGSLDLREAAARILEARAQRGISEAGRFPTIDASGSVSRQRFRFGTNQENVITATNTLYGGGFDATWELDLFGRLQRQVEASTAQLEASEEAYRDVLVTLLAEVALNYVEVRSFQMRLAVAEANRDAQAKTLELVQANFEGGEVSRLDVEQARSNLESTRSQIPTLETSLAQAKHRLAVLLGQPPGSLDDELHKFKRVPLASPSVAIGVPANMLRRRPDIRRAERELAAQTAQIGVATAELYPKFTLIGSIGLESFSASDFFVPMSRVFKIGPAVQWNIFDAGRIRRNIEVQNAKQEQALIAYEAAVLNALREVEDMLVAYGKEMTRRQSLVEAEQATRRTVEIAQDQYHAGESNFLTVLDAQRSLLNIQDQLAESDGQVTTNVISLYKALGGGWESLAPESSREPDITGSDNNQIENEVSGHSAKDQNGVDRIPTGSE
jgi:NodT family efflux transporter outer membrane factor (OMF) lipoprotein